MYESGILTTICDVLRMNERLKGYGRSGNSKSLQKLMMLRKKA
jgi:hypothetical protein